MLDPGYRDRGTNCSALSLTYNRSGPCWVYGGFCTLRLNSTLLILLHKAPFLLLSCLAPSSAPHCSHTGHLPVSVLNTLCSFLPQGLSTCQSLPLESSSPAWMAPLPSGFSTNISFPDHTHPSHAVETPTA